MQELVLNKKSQDTITHMSWYSLHVKFLAFVVCFRGNVLQGKVR